MNDKTLPQSSGRASDWTFPIVKRRPTSIISTTSTSSIAAATSSTSITKTNSTNWQSSLTTNDELVERLPWKLIFEFLDLFHVLKASTVSKFVRSKVFEMTSIDLTKRIITTRTLLFLAKNCTSLTNLRATFHQVANASSGAAKKLNVANVTLISPLVPELPTVIDFDSLVFDLASVRNFSVFDLKLTAAQWKELFSKVKILESVSCFNS